MKTQALPVQRKDRVGSFPGYTPSPVDYAILSAHDVHFVVEAIPIVDLNVRMIVHCYTLGREPVGIEICVDARDRSDAFWDPYLLQSRCLDVQEEFCRNFLDALHRIERVEP